MRRGRPASLVFSGLTLLVDFLASQWLPSIPLWIIVAVTVGILILGVALLSREKDAVTPTEQSPILRADFRNQISDEIVYILDYLDNTIVIPSRVNYSVWNSKLDAEKILLLGDNDRRSLNRFYKTIDRANEIQTQEDSSRMFQDAIDGGSRRTIIPEAKRIFEEIEWLRHRTPEVSNLLERLEQRYQVQSSDVALNTISMPK